MAEAISAPVRCRMNRGLPRHLNPGADAVSSVHWRVDSDVEDRLSGYRAEIFYP
jgi:hypothetical protein